MERDGIADVSHLHLGTKANKKNPLVVNKGFGSPHSVKRSLKHDQSESSFSASCTEKDHSASCKQIPTAGNSFSLILDRHSSALLHL